MRDFPLGTGSRDQRLCFRARRWSSATIANSAIVPKNQRAPNGTSIDVGRSSTTSDQRLIGSRRGGRAGSPDKLVGPVRVHSLLSPPERTGVEPSVLSS